MPPEFVTAELDAVFGDIGVDAAKTGMLFSRLIETVADYLEEHPVPLVVDPVMVASSGAKLLEDDAVDTLVGRLFPLATVVTPNLPEAQALTRLDVSGARSPNGWSSSAREPPSSPAATASPDRPPLRRHRPRRDPRPLRRGRPNARRRLHPFGHARGAARARRVLAAAGVASMAASFAVEHALKEIGAGEGPVDVLDVRGGR